MRTFKQKVLFLLTTELCRYLQQFPIDKLQDYTDWINLMTYVRHIPAAFTPRY